MYLGIDLGTSNSAIAGYINGEPRIFKTSDGADVLPSVIYVDRRGHRLYGVRAYEQSFISPDNVASGFKRILGTNSVLHFASSQQTMTPEECSADILRHLLGQAYAESGQSEVTGVVVTIPAAFNQMQSEATLRAAHAAELSRVALLQEPIAAAMAAMSVAKKKSGLFLIYDLGGGTFDLALVQSLSGSINIIGHEGINMLGGRDFDRLILQEVVTPWLEEHFSLPPDLSTNKKYEKVLRLAQLKAEQAKIGLSSKRAEVIFASEDDLRTTDESGKELFIEVELTQQHLDTLIGGKIDDTVVLTQKLLAESGYSAEDIDRIVFVGGPSKMPLIRDSVPRRLGIPADVQIDPMTAVALGASIYAESREWGGTHTTRKSIRSTVTSPADLGIQYDFSARTSDNRSKIRIRASKIATAGYTLQIDAPNGWTSGRITITQDCSIEVPVEDKGDNPFRILVFDEGGKPVASAGTTIVITKTPASVAGIPATHTISVKIVKGLDSSRNILTPIITKGSLLPTKGSEKFLATKVLRAGEDGHLDLELYQDDGIPEPDLNLLIGAFRIRGEDLPEGMAIRKGDEILFHWEMTDSGTIQAKVELPGVGMQLNTPKFYTPEVGHQSFEGSDGHHFVHDVLNTAQADLEEINSTIGDTSKAEVERLQKRIDEQGQKLNQTLDADEKRFIVEEVRAIRQAAARVRSAPENRGRVLEHQLSTLTEKFNTFARECADAHAVTRFDLLGGNVSRAIRQGGALGFDDADRILREMEQLHLQQLWLNPGYLVYLFKMLAEKRYLSNDKQRFDDMVEQGRAALEGNDVTTLRQVIGQLIDDQITLGTVDPNLAKLASVTRA